MAKCSYSLRMVILLGSSEDNGILLYSDMIIFIHLYHSLSGDIHILHTSICFQIKLKFEGSHNIK